MDLGIPCLSKKRIVLKSGHRPFLLKVVLFFLASLIFLFLLIGRSQDKMPVPLAFASLVPDLVSIPSSLALD
jgi:hypothetical protein